MKNAIDFKGLPCDLDAERFALVECLNDPEAADTHLAGLTENLFSIEKHRLILRTMKTVHGAEGVVDKVLVAKQADRDGTLEAMGGFGGLLDLDQGIPRIVNLEAYLRILHEKARLRHLARTCNDGVQRSAVGIDSSEEIKRDVLQALEESPVPVTSRLQTIRECIDSAGGLDGFFSDQRAQGLPVPFTPLAAMLPRFQNGRLITLGAPTGGGKSSMCRQWICQLAADGYSVVLFSLEMTSEEVFRALACTRAGVSTRRVQAGELNEADRERLAYAVSELERLDIRICDTANQTVGTMQSALKAMHAKRRADICFVDYLQLLQSGMKSQTRTEAVDSISRALKRMAMSLNVPVVSLVQWSNEGSRAAHEGQEPGLFHIRESGAIAQDSDTVIYLIPKKAQADVPGAKRPYRLAVKKNRSGPTGSVEILFDPRRTLFEYANDPSL